MDTARQGGWNGGRIVVVGLVGGEKNEKARVEEHSNGSGIVIIASKVLHGYSMSKRFK